MEHFPLLLFCRIPKWSIILCAFRSVVTSVVTYQFLKRERHSEQPIGTNATENLQNGQFTVGHAGSRQRPRLRVIIAG